VLVNTLHARQNRAVLVPLACFTICTPVSFLIVSMSVAQLCSYWLNMVG